MEQVIVQHLKNIQTQMEKKGKGGGGNSVNVRHILCEKHSKILQAYE